MPEHRYYYLETEKRIDHINIRCEFLPSVCCFATTNAHTNEFNFDTFCCPIFSIFDVLIVVRFTSSVKARHTQTDTHRVRHATRWVCWFTLSYLSHPDDTRIPFRLVSSILVFVLRQFISLPFLWPFYVRYTILFKHQDDTIHRESINWTMWNDF